MRFDDPTDPAMKPVLEAGGGESEGFEMAEQELIDHASHGDDAGTGRITSHAEHWVEEVEPERGVYGDADDIDPTEHRDAD